MTRAQILRSGVCGIALLLGTSQANAQSDCDGMLIPTKLDRQLSQEEELILAALISSDKEYNQVKQADASGSYEFGFLDLGANYEEFQTNREKLLTLTNFRLYKTEAQKVATSFLPEENLTKYVECRITSGGGLLLRAKNVTLEGVNIFIDWIPPPGVESASLLTVALTGSDIDGAELREKANLPDEWTSRQSLGFPLNRIPDQDLRLVVALGGYTYDIFLPKPPPPMEVHQPFTVSAKGNSAGENQWYHPNPPIEILSGEPLSIKAEGEAWYKVGDDGTKSGPDGTNDTCLSEPETGLACGVLVARIGDSKPFRVGSDYRGLATASGKLMLGYQDWPGASGDNGGSYDVTVTSVKGTVNK